jgi:hypothetical protein
MRQAVVDVVMDQDALGRCDGALHRSELASDVQAGFFSFDHPDDVSQMTLGALEPFHEIWVAGVLVHLFHAAIISPPGGYAQGVCIAVCAVD